MDHLSHRQLMAFETISNLKRGKTAPNFSTLADIAEVFKVPMREFFEGMDDELSSERQQLLTRLNLLAGSVDDQTLEYTKFAAL